MSSMGISINADFYECGRPAGYERENEDLSLFPSKGSLFCTQCEAADIMHFMGVSVCLMIRRLGRLHTYWVVTQNLRFVPRDLEFP
jgi:hypothetical protein